MNKNKEVVETNNTENKTSEKIFHITQYKTDERDVLLRVNKEIESEVILDYFHHNDETNGILDDNGIEWNQGDSCSGNCNITEQDPEVLELYPNGDILNVSLNENGTLEFEYDF